MNSATAAQYPGRPPCHRPCEAPRRHPSPRLREFAARVEVIGARLEPSAARRVISAGDGNDADSVRASGQRDNPVARLATLLNNDVDAHPRESDGKVIAKRADDPPERWDHIIAPDCGHHDYEQLV
jgi:hypothetical protein